ncbi:hypothetical protein Tsubulata_007619 [Turnera subulata]|uniref:Uncharacterized protein n=1 Tax=Turnera subulata TaxID=218843 RepID=A0A9Q0G1D3_9ROSI|nr:hypothetical protein Tsubulata_007619 [Turnera subulata]
MSSMLPRRRTQPSPMTPPSPSHAAPPSPIAALDVSPPSTPPLTPLPVFRSPPPPLSAEVSPPPPPIIRSPPRFIIPPPPPPTQYPSVFDSTPSYPQGLLFTIPPPPPAVPSPFPPVLDPTPSSIPYSPYPPLAAAEGLFFTIPPTQFPSVFDSTPFPTSPSYPQGLLFTIPPHPPAEPSPFPPVLDPTPFPIPPSPYSPLAEQRPLSKRLEYVVVGVVLNSVGRASQLWISSNAVHFFGPFHSQGTEEASDCYTLTNLGLLFPTALHYTHAEVHHGKSELALPRFSSCVMLVLYGAYLFFHLKSQGDLYVPISEEQEHQNGENAHEDDETLGSSDLACNNDSLDLCSISVFSGCHRGNISSLNIAHPCLIRQMSRVLSLDYVC